MHKFIITFTSTPGDYVDIIYNEQLRLIKIDATNALKVAPAAIQFVKQQMPTVLTDAQQQFKQLIEASQGAIQITHGVLDVSFEVFWDAYNVKRHKIPAQKLFEKLTYQEKVKCINSIAAYDKYVSRKDPNGTWYNKQLPDTYLRQREFETEWDTVW